MHYYSQLGQDSIVDFTLKGKNNGFFLDVGASFWDRFSNTYFFEKYRNWRGIGVDLEPSYLDGWRSNRHNSVLYIDDATKIDYQHILDVNNAPNVVDYLSIDVDPPTTFSLDALYKIFQTNRIFNVITFECDYGGDVECNFTRKGTRDESREFLKSKGYILVQEIYDRGKPWYHVDDLWILKSYKYSL